MSINYVGADVDCKMTEIAIEKNGKIQILGAIVWPFWCFYVAGHT